MGYAWQGKREEQGESHPQPADPKASGDQCERKRRGASFFGCLVPVIPVVKQYRNPTDGHTQDILFLLTSYLMPATRRKVSNRRLDAETDGMVGARGNPYR